MKKYALRTTLAAVALATTMTGMTVFADDIDTLKGQKSAAQSEVDSLQNELSYLLIEMNDLETKTQETQDSITQVSSELQASQALQQSQYEDMKLRIKYMYEDQATSMMETLITSESMSEVLNKAEYMQQVYDYDRQKLDEMAQTAQQIKDQKVELENEKASLDAYGQQMTEKQALLYSTIADKQDEVADFDAKLVAANEAAQKKAAEEAAAKEAAAKSAASASKSYGTSVSAAVSAGVTASTGDSSIGQQAVSIALSYRGIPYVYGNASPEAGFDCSGLTSYVYAKLGIKLSRSSGGQQGNGVTVNGIANALPGDIICYPGHVAIYMGNGQIVHAPTTGDVVKVSSVNILPIVTIRRVF